MKNNGLTTIAIGASYGSLVTSQIQATTQAGIKPEVYGFLEFNDRWQYILQRAIDQVTPDVKRFWIDCEADVANFDQDQVVQRIRDGVAYARVNLPAGTIVGLYSAAWWWRPYTGDYASNDLCDLPLWYAAYGLPEDRWDHGEAFGGWKHPNLVFKQYEGSATYFGLNVDLNIVLENDMTLDEVKAYVDPKVTALFLNALQNGKDIMASQAATLALGNALATHIQTGGSAADNSALQAQLDILKKQQADLLARINNAANSLGGN